MTKVAITGGCGYIGSHTLVDLISKGYEVVSIDNNSRSYENILNGVETITGKRVKNYCVDVCNYEDLKSVFEQEKDINGIIHFAAFKSVPESIESPLLYYRNNINSLVNILNICQDFDIQNFIFSSSCSVYGNADELPVGEYTPLKKAECAYARSKQQGEEIILDMVNVPGSKLNTILLRYFNPVGAHTSAEIGETPFDAPNNLVPVITETASGKREQLSVFGADYDTRDGSCIRDFVHVMDIADAHTKALEYLFNEKNSSNYEIFNLGTGNGVSILEAINAFEKVSGQKLNYRIGDRREGDVVAIYADNQKAKKELGWTPQYGIEEMMDTAWKWQLKLNEQ